MYQNKSIFGIFPIFLFSIRKSCCRLSSTEEWNFQIWSLGCRADMLLSEGKGGGKEGSSKRNRISKLYNQQSKTWTRWSSYFDLQFKYCTNVDNLSVKQLCVMPVIWDKSDMRMRACEKLLNGIVIMWLFIRRSFITAWKSSPILMQSCCDGWGYCNKISHIKKYW